MKRVGKNLIFVKWIISYLFILIIVLIAGVGIYFYSYKIISGQQKDINKKILEKVETEVNRYFYVAKNAAVSLMLDEDLERIGHKSTNLSIEDREIIYRLYKNIQNKISSAEELEHIFVWFLNGSTVISDSGHMDKELFYSLCLRGKNISFADIEKKIAAYSDNSVIMLSDAPGKGEIICFTGKHGRGNDKAGAVIAVTISTKELTKQLETLKLNERTGILLSMDGHTIALDNSENEEWFNESNIEEALKGREINGADTVFYSEVLNSENGIKYILLTPASLAAGEAGKIQVFSSLSLLICLTIGSISAFYFAKNNYDPLQKIMHLFGEYKKGNGAKDEYDWLTQKANQIIEKHEEVKNRYAETRERFTKQFLFRVITLPYNLARAEEAEQVLFDKPYNLVSLIRIEEEKEEIDMERDLYLFILNNIIGELAGERFKVITIDITECFAMVINSVTKDSYIREEIEEIFDRTSKFMLDKFGLRIKIFFGSWHSGIEGVHTSYLRAREALEYKDIINDSDTIWYEDIKNRHMIYSYSPEAEQKIINLIQIADIDKAYDIISDIIDVNYHKREITTSMKKCLTSDIMGTLIKAVQQSGNTDFILRYMEEHDIQKEMSERAVLKNFKDLLYEIKENSSNNKKKDNCQLGTKVTAYVKENFANPDLNISITALHFGITPSYLSALFKEQTGLSLLEFINQTRIECAKELLKTDMSLNDVSEQSGFRNSGALIRVFKKITGLTPGQMRDNFEK